MGKGGGMATQGLTNYFGPSAIGGLLGGANTINASDYANQLSNIYVSSGTQQWQIGYSPSTNQYQYYQSPQPQNRNLPILERLRSEIKDWHGEVLKV
jgi:hypothetical protein